MLRKLIQITLPLLIVWPFMGHAQQFDFRNFSVGDGLAQSQVFALMEDERGLIWLGTRGGGLSRFDGKDFQTITTREGLVNNYVLSLEEDSKGGIWVGTNNGLSYYNGKDIQNFLRNDSIPTAITTILQASDGTLWIGADIGIFHFKEDSLINYSKDQDYFPPRPNEIFEDRKGQIWIAHNRGITKIDKTGKRTTYARKSGLRNTMINSVAEDSLGNIWVGSYGGGVSRWAGRRFQEVLRDEPLMGGLIFDMKFDDEGSLWMATQNKGVLVWRTKDSTLISLDESVGLSNNHVRSILKDSWGNMWFGTSGGGVSKYYGQQFIHYDQSSGLTGKRIYALWEDQDCRIWMGISGKGVAVYDRGKFEYYNSTNDFKDIKVKALYQDRTGKVWMGTEGQGVTVYYDSIFQTFDGTNGLSGNWVRDITEDTEGRIWVATAGGGITRITEKIDTVRADSSIRHTFSFKYYNRKSGLSQGRINSLHLDKWGRMWYATENSGIGYLDQEKKIVNLRLEGGLQGNSVRSITEDSHGYLWVGTAGGGVSKAFIYQDTAEYAFTNHREGLTSSNIYLLAFDDVGNLWIGSEKGIDKASFDVDRNIIDIKHFGQSEGFVGIETTQNAVIKDREGNLWIGTMNGLTNYNPRTNISNPKPPILNITQVRLFYELLEDYPKYKDWIGDWGELKPGLQLPYNLNHLGFEFLGVDHDNPDQVRYQWRLQGSEADWSPVSVKTDVTYSNLPPGDYIFEVKSRNEDGVWTEVPASVAFSILPPFWDLWWFRAAAIGTIVLIILIVFTIRLNQVKRKAREERERLEMEKSLLELEQKALRLQMNPHFIFNALNSIQGIITLRDAKTARYFLAKFSKLMRLVLENSREPMITLAGEIQTLENYLSLEQFSRGDSFNYTIELGEDVDDEEYLIPPMILQPFIENAIIHGVAHLSTKGKITVGFECIDNQLACTITDNGVGRRKAAEIKSQRDHLHKSTALIVTQERLNILNPGEAQSIEIVDLVASNGDPAGTQVIVRIPIREVLE